jgi:hypothetical protein
MDPSRLTFTLSIEDWLAFQKYSMKTAARYRDAIFVRQRFFAILLWAIGAYVFSDVSPGVGLGAGFVVLVLTAMAFPRIARRNSLAASRAEWSKKLLPLAAFHGGTNARDWR